MNFFLTLNGLTIINKQNKKGSKQFEISLITKLNLYHSHNLCLIISEQSNQNQPVQRFAICQFS